MPPISQPPTLESLEIVKWVSGILLTIWGWLAHRYHAIHRKIDVITVDVASLKAHSERTIKALDRIEKQMDQRRKGD